MFSDLFYYDESSPSCLRWKVSVSSGQGRREMVSSGDVAGGKSSRYWHVQFSGVKYKCHRIIWELANGPTELKIDHKDGNAFNNTINNLRTATQKTNSENRRKSSANASGVTGVFVGRGSTNNYCAATWKEGDRKRSKKFSITRYGVMQAFKLACEYREAVIKQLNARGANYSERHGK